MKYTYKARTKEGNIEAGTIEAYSKEAAAVLLQKYNVFVTDLTEEKVKEPIFKRLGFSHAISKRDLMVFFRQLAVMLQSRVPVVQSLVSLSAQSKNPSFREVILHVSTLVEGGLPLSEALANYPKVFSNLSVSLLKSGEASGNISGSLNYIAEHLERENDILVQLRQAMVYPVFVMCVLFAVLTIIVVEVMPRITDLVKQSSVNPPVFTVLLLNFYTFLQHYWLVFIVGVAVIIITLVAYGRTSEGKKNYDALSLDIPLLGDLLKKVLVARFCSNVATLIASGISIGQALDITRNTIFNGVYQNMIGELQKEVSGGEKISTVLAQYPNYFPPFMVQMVKVGEETGKLDKTLVDVVNFYNKETKETIDLFSSLIEPVMIIFLGIIVATLAVSVLSPLYGALGSL